MPTRDQARARYAYERAARVPKPQQSDYKVLINGLGANVLRSGLAATMAFLERESHGARQAIVAQVLGDLAGAGIPGLSGDGPGLPPRVRALELEAYMLATREFLRVVMWLRRAVQATFEGD